MDIGQHRIMPNNGLQWTSKSSARSSLHFLPPLSQDVKFKKEGKHMSFIQKHLNEKNIWLATCVFFVAGVLLPMFTFNKFIIFNDTFSLISGILYLLKEGEIFLFLVVFAFSIIGPTYKLKIIHDLISKKELNEEIRLKYIRRLAIVGKWSMADVFVVAVLVASVKLGMLASVSVHIGIVFFGIAVILSMLLVQRQMSGYEFKQRKNST